MTEPCVLHVVCVWSVGSQRMNPGKNKNFKVLISLPSILSVVFYVINQC